MLPKPTESEFRGLTLQEMRDLVRQGCGGLDEDDMPDNEVDQMLNLAFWDLEERFPFKEKECRVEFPCTVGENMYLLPGNTSPNLVDLEAIKSVSIVDDSGEIYYLQQMTQEHWDDIIGLARTDDDISVADEDQYGLPVRWARMDESLILHPTPDKQYRIRIFFLKTLKSLVEGSVEQLNLPRGWNIMVVQGAITYKHYFMQDYNLSQQAEAQMLARVNSAVPVGVKEESNNRFAGLKVQHDAPNPPGYE